MAKLVIGSQIPEFTLPDQNGNEFKTTDVVGKTNIVLYFYPKDDTPGCTKEACSFRDQYEVFSDYGAMIIGISSQSVSSHKKFIEKYKLPFTLLSDRENNVHRMFGVNKNPFLLPGRVTFIIDFTGKVVGIFESQTNIKMHIEEALRIIKELKIPKNDKNSI